MRSETRVLQWKRGVRETRPWVPRRAAVPAELRTMSRCVGRIDRGNEFMQQEGPKRSDPVGLLDWRGILPFEADASSDRLGWVGLEAARCRAEPAFERNVPALAHHRLVLVTRPPEELDLRYEGVKRRVPTPAGAITLVPAGSPVWARSSGHKDELHIFLKADLVTGVAAETFGLDPVRL